MPILRLLLVALISVSSLYAQSAQDDSNQRANAPRDNAGAVFSLSSPMYTPASLVHDSAISASTENAFSFKPSFAPQSATVAMARFDLNPSVLLLPASQAPSAQTTSSRPKAFEYSDGYMLRSKIHKYTSIAMLPLFAAEAVVGQKLYTGGDSGSLRSIHQGLAAGIEGLFVANSAIGLWNLWEARKDPNGRKRRIVHGILMLGAGAGFAATAASAPGHDDFAGGRVSSGSRGSLHRNVAFASIGAAGAGYIYMLLTK